MKPLAETPRLLLGEIDELDELDLFEMDSDPEVHTYIEQKPVTAIEEIRTIIALLKKQYQENGIARWAVVHKDSGECVGWAGLKYFDQELNHHQYFYELGYRFKKKHWGKGYATEASTAVLNYGFSHLNTEVIYAITDPQNANSQKVLSKLGFRYIERFDYEGDPTDWFELQKTDWEKKL